MTYGRPAFGAAFVRSGETGPGGRLPVNTHGGQLGEAYIHGYNGIAEAVRQVRGQAVSQVAEASRVMEAHGRGLAGGMGLFAAWPG